MTEERIKKLAEWLGRKITFLDDEPFLIEEDPCFPGVNSWNPLARIQDAWMLVEKVKKQIFSKRQAFLRNLQLEVSNEVSGGEHVIAWPDILLFMKPEHICAAIEKLMEKK